MCGHKLLNKELARKHILKRHVQFHRRGCEHKTIVRSIGLFKKKVGCYYCGDKFEIGTNLHVHECMAHGRSMDIRSRRLLKNEQLVENWIKKECVVCNIKFHKKNEFQYACQKHVMNYDEDSQGKCNMCGDKYGRLEMEEHIRILHSGDFVYMKNSENVDILKWKGILPPRCTVEDDLKHDQNDIRGKDAIKDDVDLLFVSASMLRNMHMWNIGLWSSSSKLPRAV
jgi:hypothetical protein